MKNLLAIGLGYALALSGCANTGQTSQTGPLRGLWVNNTEGNLIGIRLEAQNNCRLFVERFMQPRTERDCRFEPQDGTEKFLVFLKDKNGLCGNEANYEFTFEEQVPLLRFYIGGSVVVMYKDEQAH